MFGGDHLGVHGLEIEGRAVGPLGLVDEEELVEGVESELEHPLGFVVVLGDAPHHRLTQPQLRLHILLLILLDMQNAQLLVDLEMLHISRNRRVWYLVE